MNKPPTDDGLYSMALNNNNFVISIDDDDDDDDDAKDDNDDATFKYFDNAAFPGSFILAAHHIANTKYKDAPRKLEWTASSLYEDSAIKGTLEDKYKLYENYPENWVMDKSMTGDVTDPAFLEKMYKNHYGKFDLYTSDLGFDVSSNYNAQEELHARANLGQILMGIALVKTGGTMITKQYTCHTAFTATLISCLTVFFEKVELCKPMFSKAGNSEIYVACRGRYAEHAGIEPTRLYRRMAHRLTSWDKIDPKTPMLLKKEIVDTCMPSILAAQAHLVETQVETITQTIEGYNQLSALGNDRQSGIDGWPLKVKNADDLKRWKQAYPIEPLADEDRLNVKEVINRRNDRRNDHRNDHRNDRRNDRRNGRNPRKTGYQKAW
jgi:hypothetical protein